MSVSLIYIRQSTPLTILGLPKPASEFTYVTATTFLPPTIDGRVLTAMSINYVIKVQSSYCDTIAIGDTLYRFELRWSQSSTNRFLSPKASESTLSHTHRVCNSLMIAANDRTHNLTMLYWSQMYSILQLSWFPIYWTESIPRHSGHINPKYYFPWPRRCGWNESWFVSVHSVNRTPIYRWLVTILSHIWLCISWDAVVVWYWQPLIS